jgi:hypothetical protein
MGSAENFVRYVGAWRESTYSAYDSWLIDSSCTEHTVRSEEVKTVVACRANPDRPSWRMRECSRESWIGRRKS